MGYTSAVAVPNAAGRRMPSTRRDSARIAVRLRVKKSACWFDASTRNPPFRNRMPVRRKDPARRDRIQEMELCRLLGPRGPGRPVTSQGLTDRHVGG
jgi:hypothetical protein